MKPATTRAALVPFDISKAISAHHADLTACRASAHECRQWAYAYLQAADVYETAANHAASQLASTLQLKWGAQP
jgi:hypothetical protein